ncbi:MAG: M3 family metallopeptidase [Calditerrivibrio sp.]|nr:M3 family metallopeptidase [Calditerrivibrio sp.]MCA1933231.1 M3 family metallopeptidase [Calditerrivibrio sp.]
MKNIWKLDGKKEKFFQLIEESKSRISDLLQLSKKDYRNFLIPYQSIFAEIAESFTPISHINSVNNSEESQTIFNECIEKLTVFYTEIGQSKDIFDAIQNIPLDELSQPQRRMIEIVKRDFILEGVHLPEDKRDRIKEINLNLSKLSTDFFQNILNDTKKYELKVNKRGILGDMPEEDIRTYFRDGEYIFNLTAPSYSSFIKYCEDESLREEIYRAYFSRGLANGEIIEKILKLRKEKANLLGFNDYVELSLYSKTAKTVDEVEEFLLDLLEKSRKYIQDDIKKLEEESKNLGLGVLKPHNIPYLIEKIKRRELELKEDEIRRYFEKDRCIDKLLEFTGDFFEISFLKTEEEVWDDSVTVYNVVDKDEVVGKLFFDLEARMGKRDGAWMNEWTTRYRMADGKLIYPKVFIVANFPPSKDGSLSMLRHSDVETLFHEMGHAVHHLLSKSEDYFISGINGVEWDVVEFPSQFIENFAFDYNVLKSIGMDISTGEEIPEGIIKKLQRERGFFAAYQLARQLEFSLFDILIHRDAYSEVEVDRILRDTRDRIGAVKQPDYVKFQNQFSHIFSGGYAAGYYSYKWAEVLSADLFVKYRESNDPKQIKELAKNLFSKGGGVNIFDEYMRLFGGKPDSSSILKMYGVV